MLKPLLYDGAVSFDHRGSVSYNNKLLLNKVKRFYVVQNKKNNFIRAWHGHKVEAKYIMCIKGKVKVSAVKIKNFEKPNKNSKVHSWTINDKKPSVIFIPPGYANGTKSLHKGTRIFVFSTLSLKKSLKDDFRFDKNFWKI
jgi:dTDP-4-dehydrorhamnose 3,5-epimerase-like enzyme